MATPKSENVKLLRGSTEFMKTDDFESFRAVVDQLGPDDRKKVLQMYKKAYHFLKTENSNMFSLS